MIAVEGNIFFDECKLVLPLVKLQYSLLTAKALSIDALILSINVIHTPNYTKFV
jgi:hypothetical protein